jgi:prepilin-type N-terminal cleavage/methylation domain-containing protein
MSRTRQIFKNTFMFPAHPAFTLIELLVVISIIAILMAILMPALRKAKEQAREVACRSDMRQIATAIGMYQANYYFDFTANQRWFYKNGTADHAHEWQPTAAQDIMECGLLPDRKVFFCPSVRNLSHDKNYLHSAIRNRSYAPYDTAYIERNYQYPNDYPVFWSTHHWIWKKRVTGSTPKVNTISAGALLCDMSPSAWEKTNVNNEFGYQFIAALGIEQTVEHYNVLMKDMSVVNPTDSDVEINQWLWGTDDWPAG